MPPFSRRTRSFEFGGLHVLLPPFHPARAAQHGPRFGCGRGARRRRRVRRQRLDDLSLRSCGAGRDLRSQSAGLALVRDADRARQACGGFGQGQDRQCLVRGQRRPDGQPAAGNPAVPQALRRIGRNERHAAAALAADDRRRLGLLRFRRRLHRHQQSRGPERQDRHRSPWTTARPSTPRSSAPTRRPTSP